MSEVHAHHVVHHHIDYKQIIVGEIGLISLIDIAEHINLKSLLLQIELHKFTHQRLIVGNEYAARLLGC